MGREASEGEKFVFIFTALDESTDHVSVYMSISLLFN